MNKPLHTKKFGVLTDYGVVQSRMDVIKTQQEIFTPEDVAKIIVNLTHTKQCEFCYVHEHGLECVVTYTQDWVKECTKHIIEWLNEFPDDLSKRTYMGRPILKSDPRYEELLENYKKNCTENFKGEKDE